MATQAPALIAPAAAVVTTAFPSVGTPPLLDSDSDAHALDALLASCSDDDGDGGIAPSMANSTPLSAATGTGYGVQSPDSSSSRSGYSMGSPPSGASPLSSHSVQERAEMASAVMRWSLVETRAAAHTPPPLQTSSQLPQEVGDGDYLEGEGVDSSSEQVQDKSGAYDTDGASSRLSECSSSLQHTPEQKQQSLREIRLGKRRRQRQRQKDELKYLEYRVMELEAQLERLRKHHTEFSEHTLVAAQKLNVDASSASVLSGIWSQMVHVEREQLRTSIMENTRLRAQYECQLQIANGLKRLYQNQDSFAILDSSPDSGFLAKKSRMETLSDDSAIFASLSRDFDAQYAQTDAIFEAAKLSNFDGELVDEMLLRKNEHGVFYFDNLYSKVFPFEVNTVSSVLWQCLTVEQLQSFHGSYSVLKCTEDTVHTKVINTVSLPDAETTLVIHIATKRYEKDNRRVCVWEGIIEAEGPVPMRLRETGWNVIRPANALRLGERGPVTIEQASVRITPEVQAPYTETNFAVGTLTNLLIGSYHQRMEQVHFVADDLLAMQFENVSLDD